MSKSDNAIFFCPFGGVGEIGANSMLVKTPKISLLLDSGLLFPDSDLFGLDYLHPNFEKLHKHGCNALILTHAHEDHLGAVKNLLDEFPEITIYGPPLTLLVLRKKFPTTKYHFQLLEVGTSLEIGDLVLTSIHVNHSIPQTTGIHILWKNEKIPFCFFYVSDFKIDLSGQFEAPFSIDQLNSLSKDTKVRFLFADSTNILKKGKTISEAEVLKGIESALATAKSRSFISLFSSNIGRLFGIFHIAHKQNRNVYLIGKSCIEFYHIGLQLGFSAPSNIQIEPEVVSDDYGIYIISGCQGDFRGALRRLVDGEIRGLYFTAGDQFIYSAMSIPGNEEKVTRIINKIVEQGGEVVTNYDFPVHASGHPCQEDLRWLYENFKPTHATPIHGESYFLNKHEQFIKEHFPQTLPFKIFNGQAITVDAQGTVQIQQEMDFDYKFIHTGGTPIDKQALAQRRKIALAGVVFAVAKLASKREMQSLDWIGLPEWIGEFKDQFIVECEGFLYSGSFGKAKNKQEELRIYIRNLFKQKLGYAPVIMLKELK